MCTVTALRTRSVLRIACNRDELRGRAQAYPPFIVRRGSQQVLMPQDPQGGGTWIAANSAGLIFVVLNVHVPRVASRQNPPSRGLIIRDIADCSSLDEAAYRASGIPRETFAPCRLLVAEDDYLVEATIIDGRRALFVRRIDRPLLFTSSSLGDALVDGPRRVLFEQMLPSAPVGGMDLTVRQDAFHAHRWRDRPAVSVHMSRPDACTVSTTVVEARAREMRMMYQPAHFPAGVPVGLIINRQQVEDDDPSRRNCREYAAV